MICQTCKDQDHEKCRGGTWCDCLHRVRDSGTKIIEQDQELLGRLKTGDHGPDL